MIKEIRIQNFKSIRDLKLKLGRITVIIGENGCGKSNLLEGIGFASASVAKKLDNSYLTSRGIRDTSFEWVLPAFPQDDSSDPPKPNGSMQFTIAYGEGKKCEPFSLSPKINKEDGSFEGWITNYFSNDSNADKYKKRFLDLGEKGQIKAREAIDSLFELPSFKTDSDLIELKDSLKSDPIHFIAILMGAVDEVEKQEDLLKAESLSDFIIFAPENTTLRTPPPEGAALPLGPKGEGLFRLLQTFSDPKFENRLQDLKARLHLFGWFDDFITPDDSSVNQAKLKIRDRWIDPERKTFDQRSANEGFLYLLFYFSAVISWRTPKFFAFDNIDNALNPRLCTEAMRQIIQLAEKYDKQIICTTHNPAILDGLDLTDSNQRLYTIRRDSEGRTIARRVQAPKRINNVNPVRLSEAFVRGLIGGLPEHF
ncbi:AAA family ATPase [Luteolibacter sp. SL250]|uniref:AAA family ATPase n=1 Tax=Luteolibacter sp. SL250 TaxID=2995170 RepID=UPI00226DA74C|nr:AAA family ATPase [Luteolibacter sp. SL250]WAC18282.1 AAA family ATPase [Luteolibacter sp. SL250]